ncbi:MAG: thioredoxin [Verrucomicrobiales bacterium]|jgi:thioredoxin 1|nr:thioredoxin [Verrucomicrobiales bacterium]
MKSIELTSENFDETLANATTPVLVDFHASWCGPCKMLSPVIEQIAEAKEGEAVVAKVDIEAARDIAQRYKITSVPTLIVFKDGEPVVGVRGMQSRVAIESMIAQAGGTSAEV